MSDTYKTLTKDEFLKMVERALGMCDYDSELFSNIDKVRSKISHLPPQVHVSFPCLKGLIGVLDSIWLDIGQVKGFVLSIKKCEQRNLSGLDESWQLLGAVQELQNLARKASSILSDALCSNPPMSHEMKTIWCDLWNAFDLLHSACPELMTFSRDAYGRYYIPPKV